MLKRVINKIHRIKNESYYNYLPSHTEIVREKKNTIFMYHGVNAKGVNMFNQRHTGVDIFEKQISFLVKNCNILPLSDYFEQKFDPNRANVAITFDDGYLNNFLNAKPILEKYKAHASFFITGINNTTEDLLWADFIDIISKLNSESVIIDGENYTKKENTYFNAENESLYSIVKSKQSAYEFKLKIYDAFKPFTNFNKNSEFDEYWKLMSDDQIVETSKSNYIKIGSHGYFHNNLNNIPINDAISELKMSRNYLENLAQYNIDSIAYPDGSYTRDLIDQAYVLGYKYQLATEQYHSHEDVNDPRILNRKGIYNCDTWGNQLT